MRNPQVIAIDGPAGAGKSTLGELLAARLGYLYFDTGVMYRALALAALRAGVDPNDADALADLARRVQIDVLPPDIADGRQYTVRVNGHDATWDLRMPAVERSVSLAARFPAVRAEMVRRQQEIGRRGQVVMVGRDIGTVVMPDAELKIFLDASIDERARRRARDVQSRGDSHPVGDVRADLARRDALDQHVMRPAADALILATDGLSPEQEVAWILDQLAHSP